MKYLPSNVRGTRDDARGYGYIVTLPDGTEEWHRLAWQATARAHGWMPPYMLEVLMARHIPAEKATARKGKG